MDFRGVTLLLLVISAVLLSTDGHLPKCCVAVSKRIPTKMIRNMQRFEKQSSSGLCDIDAIIIYVKMPRTKGKKDKRICAHPNAMKLLKPWMKKKQLFSSKIAAP
ncbi:C-C motif chemokine 27a [Alosa pseudoharengus]|uniref:C-C motif chemokine 27a n=1 Tax=Alosa pseudoharengus TaxID=34774 RepID=UPI003F8BDFDF